MIPNIISCLRGKGFICIRCTVLYPNRHEIILFSVHCTEYCTLGFTKNCHFKLCPLLVFSLIEMIKKSEAYPSQGAILFQDQGCEIGMCHLYWDYQHPWILLIFYIVWFTFDNSLIY